MSEQIKLSHDGLRQLAVDLLGSISNGDALENIIMLATFNSHLLAAMIVHSTNNQEEADGALAAFISDVRSLIADKFEDRQAFEGKDARHQ